MCFLSSKSSILMSKFIDTNEYIDYRQCDYLLDNVLQANSSSGRIGSPTDLVRPAVSLTLEHTSLNFNPIV